MNTLDLPEVRGDYRFNANLGKSSWFGVGGEAQVLFKPADVEDLAFFLQNKPKDLPLTVIGLCSNLLIRDQGVSGVVIKLGKGFSDISIKDCEITVGAGFLDYNLAHIAKDHGIGGLEFFSGIPGGIGGALAMNAGAYGGDTASALQYAQILDKHGNLQTLTPEEIGFRYRGNSLPDEVIFVKACFKGKSQDPEIIGQKMQEIATARENSQPIRTKTTGSTFANPTTGKKAWELIRDASCVGLKVGDAIISEKHCNFIINQGNSTAQDIEDLGESVRAKVYAHSGILLEWEVKRIGK
jgi:UDP-N-acetylmuramate dehydrogenase